MGKQVCVICRTLRTLRSHHCNEMGRCIDRMDHFCPWIDNAVGRGNQRIFFVFVVMLELNTVLFYWAAYLFLQKEFGETFHGSIFSTPLNRVSLLAMVLVLAVCFLDILWLGFVGALVIRHLFYIAANITTFEVIVRPPHVCKRFPKKTSK